MIDKHIEVTKKKLAEAQAELEKIERLRAEFPDLETYTDRWKNTRYMATSANPMVNKVEFRRSCGCCSDAGSIAMPYVEFEGHRVYSNPHYLFIGTCNGYSGVYADNNWKKQYEDAGISCHVIRQIRDHLKAVAPRGEPYEDGEDDNEEDDDSAA